MPASDTNLQSSAATTFIYALIDPRTRELRYIGKSDNPDRRLKSHLARSKLERHHVVRWIRTLTAEGLQPILEVIDEVLTDEWQAAEAAYIAFFRESGCPLTNTTLGGDGFGAVPEIWAKISATKKGMKFSLEHRGHLSMAHKGRKLSPEHNAAKSAGQTGRKKKPHSIEARARMSAATSGERHRLFGKQHSPETILKMRVAALRRCHGREKTVDCQRQ